MRNKDIYRYLADYKYKKPLRDPIWLTDEEEVEAESKEQAEDIVTSMFSYFPDQPPKDFEIESVKILGD